MFRTAESRTCIKPTIGWKDHYDTMEIAELSADLKESESGMYYQEIHPALRLDNICATLPSNRSLEEYLNEMEDAAITEMLHDVQEKKEIAEVSKELVNNDVIYNSFGWINDTIINEGRFVGIRFKVKFDIGLSAVLNRIAVQMTQAQTGLKIYLYHSHKASILKELNYTTTQGGEFKWMNTDFVLHADDADLSGGFYYLGYYQDDVTGNAIQYKKLDWSKGYCRSCDGGVRQKRYNSISKHLEMNSIYVPGPSLNAGREMFDPEAVMEVSDNNWGFNFNISVKCDLTNFICDNRLLLKKALGLKVAEKIMRSMLFSNQINKIEEQLKIQIIREIEGDRETRHQSIPRQYEKAIEQLHFNTSRINSVCLPCERKSGISYDVM